MFRVCVLAILFALALSYSFPMYKQCDSKWGSQPLGTGGGKTICQAGCLMSSAAMALAGTGHSYNPETLNRWLINNGGYASGNLYVWAAINKLGLTFGGFVGNSAIKSNLDNKKIVILNVHGGGHWVLATGYSGDSIKVNDPGYSTTSYTLSEIVNGNSGVYTVTKLPHFLHSWIYTIEELLNISEKKQEVPPVAIEHQTSNIRSE